MDANPLRLSMWWCRKATRRAELFPVVIAVCAVIAVCVVIVLFLYDDKRLLQAK